MIAKENNAILSVNSCLLTLRLILQDLRTAKVYFEKSMSEHRTPEVKTIISDLEKKIREDEIKAYTDPTKAEEAKEKGNELFNKGIYRSVEKTLIIVKYQFRDI